MAINSLGYPGSVDAKAQAVWLPMVSAAQYSVAGAGDLRVTARTTTDRGLSIAAGVAAGDGVMDTVTTADNTLALPSVAGTGSKWFLVVLRRDWTVNRSSFAIVEGTSARAIPTGRQKTAGAVSDQPLALVRVQGVTIMEFVDLRTWARTGGVFALDELVKDFLTNIGTSILIGSTLWDRVLNTALAPSWKKSTPGGAIAYSHNDWTSNKVLPVSTSANGSEVVLARFTIPDPGFPYLVQGVAAFESANAAGTRWDATLTSSKGGLLASERGDAVAPWYSLSGFTPLVATGSSVMDIKITRLSGTAAFGLSAFKRQFNLMVIPAL